MPRSRHLLPFAVASLTLVVAALVVFDVPAPFRVRASVAPSALAVTRLDAVTLRDEALSLYAAGNLAPACERFSRAAADEPSRADAASCFETWAWQALRESRPDEAWTLFAEGLRERPRAPGLLRGLGIAAIHAGRPDEAIAPLEAAVAATGDTELRVLLARVYDRRDDEPAAARHLRAVLAREPRHARARALLADIERDRETHRALSPHFLVKWRDEIDSELARVVLALLETAHRRLDAQLGYRPSARITAVLYGDREFRDATRAHGWVDGLFDGKIRVPVRASSPTGPALDRLITHEYAHAAIHDLSRGRAPRWLHEGLAQYLEGAPADRPLRLGGTLTLAGLDTLIADPDPLHARTGYDAALWVVNDLSGRGGLGSLRALLDRIATGEAVAAAVSRVYALRLAELESQWRHLLNG